MTLRGLVPVYGRRQPLRGQDISRRIDVAIVEGTAATAYPCPYPQPIDACGSTLGVTERTGAAGVSFIDDPNASTGVLAFIQKLRFQDSPTAIEHGFGHPCLDELQGADIADENILIFINDSPGELMQCIVAPPAGPAMKAFCLPFVPPALRLGYFGFKTSVELARPEPLAIARDRRILEP